MFSGHFLLQGALKGEGGAAFVVAENKQNVLSASSPDPKTMLLLPEVLSVRAAWSTAFSFKELAASCSAQAGLAHQAWAPSPSVCLLPLPPLVRFFVAIPLPGCSGYKVLTVKPHLMSRTFRTEKKDMSL